MFRRKPKGPAAASMKMDVMARTSGAVAAAIAAVVLLVVVLLAWIGGELHHRSCLAEVELEYPVTERSLDAERAAAADGCSRWPF
jgi:hypothetical protein